MTPELVVTLGRQAIEILLMVAAPLLLVALILGLVVAIFQAATQINEATLSFIPKLAGILVMLVLAGPWMITVLVDYTREILMRLPALAG